MAKRRSKRRKRIRKVKITILAVIAAALFASAIYAGIYTAEYDDLPEEINELTLEIGSDFPSAYDFLDEEYADTEAEIVTDSSLVTMDLPGDYTITLSVNKKKYTTILHLIDTEAPVIEGVSDISVELGESISYKSGVTVTDNSSEEIEVEVDNSEVDVSTVGEYTVVYSATDSSGNSSQVTATVSVTEPEVNSTDDITEALVLYMAQQILDEILTDDMTTQYEQAEAIYWYCHENIAFIGTSDKTNWLIGAYEGMTTFEGDCYTYFSVAKALLTQAGIENMDIYMITDEKQHYWNLIDVGEGWYHFDSCRRKDGTTFFYWTDEELMEYSEANDGSHAYDQEEFADVDIQ